MLFTLFPRLAPRRRQRGGAETLARRFARAADGTVVMVAACGLPVLMVLGVGAIELQQVWSDKQQTQDVADAASLMGAQQLRIDAIGATGRAKAFAEAQLADLKQRSDVTVGAAIVSRGVMKVAIDTHRMSFFANLLPPGGFYTHAESTGKGEGMGALCVLGIGAASALDDVQVQGSSKLDAAECMVHANHDLRAESGASMVTDVAEAVGTSSGAISPTVMTGAATIDDPFEKLDLTPPAACNSETTDLTKGKSATLKAGLHCNPVTITIKSVKLAPGEHWFKAGLTVGASSTLDGSGGVALVFQNGATMTLATPKTASTSTTLTGTKTGRLAGFVLATTRDYTSDFHLQSDPIKSVTGTIYMPAAALVVDGTRTANAGSPWTVVAARAMSVTGAANLIINANYAFSDVPLPNGVGNKARYTRLVK